MATTTTVFAVQAAFVTEARTQVEAIADAQDVTVWRVWPGQEATRRMVFFTDIDWNDTEDAYKKAGRRYRNEDYSANFEIWVFPEGGEADAASAYAEAEAIYDACEEAIIEASSPVRAVDGVTHIVCQPTRLQAVTVDENWAIVINARLAVTAQLT